jgi:hypothetical protein
MSITVNCNVSWGDNAAVHFTYADIPIVLYLETMNSHVPPPLLQMVSFHVNDNRIICNLYELSLPKVNLMVKSELNNADLKMTTKNGFTLLKLIDEHGMIDDGALQKKYPDDMVELFMNYDNASSSGNNEAFKIYEKSREIFTRMMKGRGGSRSRRLIRSRHKTKRVKRTKSMKRYNRRRYKRA